MESGRSDWASMKKIHMQAKTANVSEAEGNIMSHRSAANSFRSCVIMKNVVAALVIKEGTGPQERKIKYS